MKRGGPLKRYTALKKRRVKVRPGRLKGKELHELREHVYQRDAGLCGGCSLPVDPKNYHLAHVRNKRMWGDNPDNVRIKHPYCHLVIEHTNGGTEKIVPKK